MKKLIIILAAMLLMLCGCSREKRLEQELEKAKSDIYHLGEILGEMDRYANYALDDGKYASGSEKYDIYYGALENITFLYLDAEEYLRDYR